MLLLRSKTDDKNKKPSLVQLTLSYPLWYLLLCLALGVAAAVLLYRGETNLQLPSKAWRYALATLRALAVAAIAALLLQPLLRTQQTDIKKPIVALLQDQSESIVGTLGDTAAYQTRWNTLADALGKDYEVHRYAIGERVREGINFQLTDKQTNLSDAFQTLYDQYSTQNLGAVVVATDGIFNEGANPIYVASKLNAAVYTVALGDTTPKKDVVVKRVAHNNIAYLGDQFNIEIDVAANNCTGATIPLSVARVDASGNASPVQSANVAVTNNHFFTTKSVTLTANQAGVVRYRITAGAVAGEATTLNNVKDIFIEVLDARTKILLLANAPHPDLAAISEAITTNKNYNITVAYASELKANVTDFDFVILHQLPSLTNGVDAILSQLNTRRTPRMFIVGGQTDVRKLSAAQNLVSINADVRQPNDAQGILNGGFNLFTLDANYKDFNSFNPMTAPFGEFKELGGQTLFYQRIGKVETKYPLVTLGEVNGGARTGVVCGEGLWKWRLFDYLQHQNHDLFDGMLSKIVQYLSVKEDKRKFRVTMEKNVFKENETVNFTAEQYNNSYELVNDADVSMVLTNAQNKQFNYTFTKNGKAYALNAGVLPVGNYSYKASTVSNGQPMTATGSFSVQPIQLERYETTADHALLRVLAEKNGGAMVYPNDIAQLATLIKQKNTIKPMLFTTNRTESILNWRWLFGILFVMLSVEWFLRRYFGGY
jgi:hypothetical protein